MGDERDRVEDVEAQRADWELIESMSAEERQAAEEQLAQTLWDGEGADVIRKMLNLPAPEDGSSH